MFPYQSKVFSKYGAPMRRRSDPPHALTGKIHLRRVPFVDGDYDQGGAYWGGPADLWCAWHDRETTEKCRACSGSGALYLFDDLPCDHCQGKGTVIEIGAVCYIRAPNRAAAKAHFPAATFYR